MDRLTPSIVILIVVVGVFGLMYWGWRGRQHRQAGIAAPAAPPAGYTAELTPVPGMYVATTHAGENLERINVHALGVRTNGALFVGDQGVAIEREGADDIFIPAAAVEQAHAGSGMIGKFVERDGLIIIRWNLGGTRVDTGFRPREHAQTKPAIAAVDELIGHHA
ncbi:ABC transporter permease [Brevibacterium sp. 50QC2O2]|jgi:hypothetical protein|uniref:PH-like domain-containing protein n=1 Tax=Brevibacterium TaxID=1696 RepID=UPI00211C7CC4|nr:MULTISPECIES: ABC transporter permease [unclassified Brevibacterium]MCQ9366886.1 ABC transporter permease [Brevibacterium sp. 91QC2O2]MCQ9384036.1 ABC transporter permease [Brevibacterium sp. 68QC2CO]MCQ9389110.1 ABC transporter permease [Brevibacterium sp. 50QC2O2]